MQTRFCLQLREMFKKTKKILQKEFTLPNPENIFNKQALIFFIVILALFFDLLILNYTKVFLGLDKTRVVTPLEQKIGKLVAGYPIAQMAPYIATQNEQTAAFLVGIAKKESNWGKYSPKLNGKNCYNYWGYRGQGKNVTPSGYTCFKNPQEAVDIVGKRISDLINFSNLNTPSKMVVWKCGWDCNQHSNESVKSWIDDVGYYYKKFY